MIGANSVVTRDLPQGVIVAGAPAKVIREIEFMIRGGALRPPSTQPSRLVPRLGAC